ncbi:MAG: PVC-type heme-binding CxxCH protein [Bacteroidota bacterium]
MRQLTLGLLVLLGLLACEVNTPSLNTAFSDLPETEQRLAENALKSFNLHSELELQLFAHEPMLVNPTNLDIDERGRAWVLEATNYRLFNNDFPLDPAGDRILILEDTNGDGQADSSKVFYQGTDVNAALGIAKLGQHIYVAASPNLLIFTDADGDDIPEKKDTLFTGLDGIDHDHGVHAIVFGPDGKLYFNFGNEGKRLRHKDGQLATDIHGNRVEEGQSFRQGMIFRCNPDGSELEILGHNFRNNFEVAVDAFGSLWQSDNDDDGNEATRINYVMEYGNYGYQDEMTGAGWRAARVGMHAEIPQRHWHLNDPGVVPNLLQTGAGSPTGILVYEGVALPQVFQSQMIHCEPGQNVVRSYPVSPTAAGYSAELIPLMESMDSWFRPSDICAAPDGSLLVADWYDAGVGGHLMADQQRGRIYRLYQTGNSDYLQTAPDLNQVELAIANLNHVNQATRYLAFQKVIDGGEEAITKLQEAITASDYDLRQKARMLFALAAMPDCWDCVDEALQLAYLSQEPQLRMVGIRIARSQLPAEALIRYLQASLDLDHPFIRREAALSLRYLNTTAANELWVQLANAHDGKDRWYLEALGIAADLFPDERLKAFLAVTDDLDTPTARDIVWRSRSALAAPYLEGYLSDPRTREDRARYFRALHFIPAEAASSVLEKLLSTSRENPQREEILQLAVNSFSAEQIENSPVIQAKIEEIVPSIRGTADWLMIIRNGQLKEEARYLFDTALAIVSTEWTAKSDAIKLVTDVLGHDFIKQEYVNAPPARAAAIMDLARYVQTWENNDWLRPFITDQNALPSTRRLAASALANDWTGMEHLLTMLQEGEVLQEDEEAVATILTQVWRANIRQEAITWWAEQRGAAPLDLEKIAQADGEASLGQVVFETHCWSCHQVEGEGVRFGPDLSLIGDKLGPDALLAAIIYPNQGIGFGYEGYEIDLKDGRKLRGYLESQTEDEISLRQMGGVSLSLNKTDILAQEALNESLMTANLQLLMSEEELVNLLAYLQTLTAAR